MHRDLLRIRRGHAPNCSSGSSVVGTALLSTALAGALINAFAHRFRSWSDTPPDGEGGPPGLDAANATPPDGQTPGAAGWPRLRREAFGAILSWAGLQLYLSPSWTQQALAAGATVIGQDAPAVVPGALRAPTEAHLTLTDRCPVRCQGCYRSAGPEQPHTEVQALREDLQALAGMGVLEIAFGGGEILLHPQALEILRETRQLGMTPNLTTSGFGLTKEVAGALAGVVGQVNVSLDGLAPLDREVRGWSGAARALQAIATLRAAGVRVGVNTVLSGPLLGSAGALPALGRAIADAGAQEWLWLRFKPSGRGREQWARLAPSIAQLQQVWPTLLDLEAQLPLTFRLDCAMVPFLADAGVPAAHLHRLGVVGCIGAESLWSRDQAGRWAPCSFAAAAAAGPTLAQSWRDAETLQRWRARASDPPHPCATCDHQAICRGGCRIVAEFLTGDAMAPDPQCPRVAACA